MPPPPIQEYLLIISSDHGKDTEIFGMHGDGLHGNIGYAMFYNPAIRRQNETNIDIVKFYLFRYNIFYIFFVSKGAIFFTVCVLNI